MNPRIALSLLSLACADLARADDSVVRFANGDHLSGTMQNLSDGHLIWKSPILDQPAPFFLNQVLDLTLPAVMPMAAGDHVATLKLTNGDTVRGQLSSVTDESIALDTWFAGRMTFNRVMVSSVEIEEYQKDVYRGPLGLAGWQQSESSPAWSYERLAFRSNKAGSIARADVLPDECSVSFDIAWKSDALTFKVILFSKDVTTDQPGSGYEVLFQQSSVNLRNGKTQRALGSRTHATALRENDRVRVEIRASAKSGKVCLLVNDRMTEVWTDPDVAQGEFGGGLHLVSLNAYPVKVSGIRVGKWDGIVDQLPDPQAGELQFLQGLRGQAGDVPPVPENQSEADGGRMKLANGDSIDGEVKSIADGIITVSSSLGEIRLPVSRFRSVALKPVNLERCIRRNGDVRAWFPDRSSIVFRFDGLEDGMIIGSSQNFGEARFKLGAFDRLEFNIYEPGLEDKRGAEAW